MLTNLRVDGRRLWDDLMVTAAIGGTAKGGIKRLTLTQEDRRVRDWFKATCEGLGCTVHVDEIGNMFAVRPGRRADLAPIAMGSHLDTQPTGGKFDGVLGVLGAIEALRTMVEAGYETTAPIAIANWTNEEGSRFSPAMLCSGAYAGIFTKDFALSRQDRDGVSLSAALDAIGYRGSEKLGERKFQAMFELHIEQGPILEATTTDIGVVQGVQGMRWYEVTLLGRDGHTGATPMNLRKNALVGAARVIDMVDRLGNGTPGAVATVGLIENKPNSRNVIPGEVFFTVDLRHAEEDILLGMEKTFRAELTAIAETLGLECAEAMVWNSPAVHFDKTLIDCVRHAAAKNGASARDMVSGAGHDAAYTARVMPTTMIFVPCAGGLSHNEAESTTLEECAIGAQVLLDAVLEYDRLTNG